MDKYIKIDTVKKTLLDYIHEFDEYRANPDFVRGITYAREVLDRIPLEDVAPVVHGRWISLTECSNAGVYCSICHKKVYKEDYAWCNRKNKVRSSYCPNCGAKMDGGC